MLALVVWQEPYIPAKLVTSVPPVHPTRGSPLGAMVALEVTVNEVGRAEDVRLLHGGTPFGPAAIRAASEWTFEPARRQGPVRSKVGAFVLFRPSMVFLPGPATRQFEWTCRVEDCAALPRTVSYPPYPSNTIAEGVVLLELRIKPEGTLDTVAVLRDIPPLTQAALETVRSWQFSPAKQNGEPVPGTTVVAISFQRPFVQPPAKRPGAFDRR